MYDKHFEHPRKYARRDCSTLYPCIYLVFCCVGALSIGKDRVRIKQMSHFFYTQHSAEPYIRAIQKLNELRRTVVHHGFINLKNSKLLNCINFCKACIPSSNTLQDLNLNELTLDYKATTNKLTLFQILHAHSAL